MRLRDDIVALDVSLHELASDAIKLQKKVRNGHYIKSDMYEVSAEDLTQLEKDIHEVSLTLLVLLMNIRKLND